MAVAKKKGRRSASVKKKAEPKRKVAKQSQSDLFEKRSKKHKQISELALETLDAKNNAKKWDETYKASRDRLTALLRAEGIKGPYKADGATIKPLTQHERHSCKVEPSGEDTVTA